MCFISPLVVKVPQKTLLMDALKEETEIVYDFCMCNPPFFANQLEAKVRSVPVLLFTSRSSCDQPQRHSGASASKTRGSVVFAR